MLDSNERKVDQKELKRPDAVACEISSKRCDGERSSKQLSSVIHVKPNNFRNAANKAKQETNAATREKRAI